MGHRRGRLDARDTRPNQGLSPAPPTIPNRRPHAPFWVRGISEWLLAFPAGVALQSASLRCSTRGQSWTGRRTACKVGGAMGRGVAQHSTA